MPTDLQRPILGARTRSVAQCCSLVLLCLTLFQTDSLAQLRESELKAAFIFNFAQFVEWPERAFKSTNAPFVIGVAGSSQVEDALTQITAGQKVRGREIKVRPIRSPAQAAETHILYVAAGEASRWPQFQRRLRGTPILTVSDAEYFARRGGMIELYSIGRNIRLRANPDEAKGCELALSSRLLRLADLCVTEEIR